MNQELQAGRDLALHASRLKSQFLARMSHELRTPLNSIIGYTQFVLQDQDRPLAEDQQEDLRRVLAAAHHLLDLINNLLDLARIESGKETIRVSNFRLPDLAASVLDSVAPMAKEKGLELICEADADLPEMESDEKKLRQVLLNLVANAVNFTERGSVHLKCKRAGRYAVRIDVIDTGIGIPKDQLGEIFNEFHQVGPGRRRYAGTGLGLAIARRLLEMLGGSIEVQSEVGKGANFTVTVPIELELEKQPQLQQRAATTGV